jgi:hypothetical protein
MDNRYEKAKQNYVEFWVMGFRSHERPGHLTVEEWDVIH